MHLTRPTHGFTRILVLAVSPINQPKLRLDEEVREIDEGLRRSKRRDCFKLEQRWAVGRDDVRRALLDLEPHIVHFCGHGADEEGLILEDDAGQAKFVSTEALENLFELCKDHVECVVLNACYSEKQANAIAHHIGYVIGMTEAIGDRAAIKFAVGFYDALGAGRSVDDAHKFGCSAIQMENLPQYLIPIIKINSDAGSAYTKKIVRKQNPLINRIIYSLKYD
ncbi:CHAT domain-containing protein [Nostoc sp.]|uniref:CHAT domain-containing protein n=1 Tax=Nostoc sp. TaxID=1180 RepID=UPI002FFA1B39